METQGYSLLCPRSTASLASARIVALHRKVWLPPRYLALRLVPIMQVQASLLCAARFQKHRAFHGPAIDAQLVQASSRCTARFAHEEVPCTVRFIPSPIRWVRAIAIQHCMVLRNRNFFDSTKPQHLLFPECNDPSKHEFRGTGRAPVYDVNHDKTDNILLSILRTND